MDEEPELVPLEVKVTAEWVRAFKIRFVVLTGHGVCNYVLSKGNKQLCMPSQLRSVQLVLLQTRFFANG